MSHYILILLSLFFSTLASAGVYGDLQYGDDRETVTRKLGNSALVTQTIGNTFIGRTGLNGIFKCKAKLAGLTCHLYFNWDAQGGLNEITLRSGDLNLDQYDGELLRAWNEASALFSKAYGLPAQKTTYPPKLAFQQHKLLVTHVWSQAENQSILIGPGIDKGKCFLFIRFVNEGIELKKSP